MHQHRSARLTRAIIPLLAALSVVAAACSQQPAQAPASASTPAGAASQPTTAPATSGGAATTPAAAGATSAATPAAASTPAGAASTPAAGATTESAAGAATPAAGATTAAAGAATPAAGAAAGGGTIQIAWAGPLTGDVAQQGTGWLNGAKMAVDEWNAKGGVLGKQVTIDAEDDACDPKQASTVGQKIADDPKNVLLIGHFCSGTTLAAGPIEHKANLPQITLSSNPSITQQGWTNLFRPIANDNVQGAAGVNYVMQKLGIKKFALLNDKQAFGQGINDVSKQTIEKAGGTVTSIGGVEPKDVDYSAILTNIIQVEQPDAIVYCTNFPTSAGLMTKQIRALGFNKPIIGCDGWFDPAMIAAAGDAAECVSEQQCTYITFETPPYNEDGPQAVQEFAKKFQAKYGSPPNGYEIYGYDFGNLAMNAIQKAGSTDHQKIIDALKAGGIPGVLIPEYNFDANGDVKNAPMYIFKVTNGKYKLEEQYKGAA